MTVHPIDPVFDAHSKILILGSFPSVRSREEGFFYGHPQNRFRRVLASVTKDTVPQTIEEKKTFLLRHGIALWDVIASCEIEGSADASIRHAAPTDLSLIFDRTPICAVFTNGKTAHRLYEKLQLPQTKIPDVCLASTSPANAQKNYDSLCALWEAALASYLT